MSEDTARSLIEFTAPAKWQDLKSALKDACARMTTICLKIEESDDALTVKRIEGSWTPKVLYLRFDPHVPKIRWQCCDPYENRGEIVLRVYRESVFYVVNNVNRTLAEIVLVLTSCLTGKP